jgi:hypothetical protein
MPTNKYESPSFRRFVNPFSRYGEFLYEYCLLYKTSIDTFNSMNGTFSVFLKFTVSKPRGKNGASAPEVLRSAHFSPLVTYMI